MKFMRSRPRSIPPKQTPKHTSEAYPLDKPSSGDTVFPDEPIWIKLTCCYSFYWIYLPCPLQNIMFNVWISMASWLMLKCSLPSPTTKPYIEHMKKRNLESFLKFTAHRPYKTTRWTYGEISHVEWCLGFPSLRPCRTNSLRYEESCHAESF